MTTREFRCLRRSRSIHQRRERADGGARDDRARVERRGGVLEILQELLQERRDGDVLSLVSKLVARNSELERRLAQLLSRTRKNEGVSEAQLKFFMDALTTESEEDTDPALADANQKLREASGIDESADGASKPDRKRQGRRWRPTTARASAARGQPHRGAGGRSEGVPSAGPSGRASATTSRR